MHRRAPNCRRVAQSKRGRLHTAGALVLLFIAKVASAAGDISEPNSSVPPRPAIMFNRWQEDWSVLADPDVPREAFDELKYIPLSQDDPQTYLSLGANLRERYQSNDAPGFGVGTNRSTDYDISRMEVDADLRLGAQVQVFTQLQSDYAWGHEVHSPVDQDRLDLEQGFIAVTEPVGDGSLKIRLGRQEIGFDLQRFVSVRNGPNVRQSYDAAWVDYEQGPWRYITFYSHPVQDRDVRPFDDYGSTRLTYGGFRVERKLTSTSNVSAYYSRFTEDAARFVTITGNERRDILDLHFDGTSHGLDWDIEAMTQDGRIGAETVQAWAFGSVVGYTLSWIRWAPRLGLQVDASSGDKNPHDNQLNTFNPLFPNGYYVTLAGYTGLVNFIHVKPFIVVTPKPGLKLLMSLGAQWRETTADAIYTLPSVPVANTAGRAGSYTGVYAQFRTDWALTRHISLALEAVHFQIGDVIREAGGHESNYIGVEFAYGW